MTLWAVVSAASLGLLPLTVLTQIAASPDPTAARCLSNLRTLAGALLMYSEDHDGRFPLAMTANPKTGRWRTGESKHADDYGAVPHDWRPSHDQERTEENLTHWANSIRPYVPGFGAYRCPLAPAENLIARGVPVEDYLKPRSTPASVTYAFNGLLHTYRTADIGVPKCLPLIWEGHGKLAMRGFALSNPFLKCRRVHQPCVYDGRNPQLAAGLFAWKKEDAPPYPSYWVHGHGLHIAYADGHAARIKVGEARRLGTGPAYTDWRTDPYATYDEGGHPTTWWNWAGTPGGSIPILFRPDYWFDN